MCERGAYRVMGVRWVLFCMKCGLLCGDLCCGVVEMCVRGGGERRCVERGA